jgi:hypothetical protein
MGRAQIEQMGSTRVRIHSSGVGTLLQGVRQQSIPQSEEGLRSYYEALHRASVQVLAHTDVESGPSNTSSGSVLRDVHSYSEGAARGVIGSVQPKQQRKVRDVVVDVCEEDPESKNLSHGLLASKLTATETSSSAASDDEFVRLLQTGSSSAFERLHVCTHVDFSNRSSLSRGMKQTRKMRYRIRSVKHFALFAPSKGVHTSPLG